METENSEGTSEILRIREAALLLATDLAKNGNIGTSDILSKADEFYRFLLLEGQND